MHTPRVKNPGAIITKCRLYCKGDWKPQVYRFPGFCQDCYKDLSFGQQLLEARTRCYICLSDSGSTQLIITLAQLSLSLPTTVETDIDNKTKRGIFCYMISFTSGKADTGHKKGFYVTLFILVHHKH